MHGASTTDSTNSDDTLAARIRDAKHQLEQMIDSTPQAMLLMSGDGKVLRANRSLLDLLGQASFSDVLGRPLAALFDCEDKGFFDVLGKGQDGYTVRDTNVRLDGGRIHSLSFSVVGSEGSRDSFVVVVQDTTEQKKQARLIENTFKKEAVQALMGALMHHLNQPLTVISVRAKLLQIAMEKGEAGPEELKRTLADITDLVMGMAETMKKVERVPEFVTRPYVDGLRILDIE